MAEQNLFTKYGIKEVADVTFYRIEKKSQNYEVQRKIPVSSILKGVISTQKVYPVNDEGIGDVDGFDAFVFSDADIITGTNYDCDDTILVKEVYTATFTTTTDNFTLAKGMGHDKHGSNGHNEQGLEKAYQDFLQGKVDWGGADSPDNSLKVINYTVKRWDANSGEELTDSDLADYQFVTSPNTGISNFVNTTSDGELALIKVEKNPETKNDNDKFIRTYQASYPVYSVYEEQADLASGAYKNNKSKFPDFNKDPGTHEYSYAKQATMIFAREQNLITKLGTRYSFSNIEELFGNIAFDDSFVTAPNSSEKVVVVGIAGKITAGGYDIEKVREEINSLTTTIDAKAYDVTYKNYVELVVEDEMGYYRPDFLGTDYKRNTDGSAYLKTAFDMKTPTEEDDDDYGHSGNPDTATNAYAGWAAKHRGVDQVLARARMWGDQQHFSINDAIDALRHRRQNLDVNIDASKRGIRSIFGGYRVGKNVGTYRPRIGYTDDSKFADGKQEQFYTYLASSGPIAEASSYKSHFNLEAVLEKLTELAYAGIVDGLDVRVDPGDTHASNRAIYVNVATAVSGSGSHIYILKNKAPATARDEDGIFEFEDKKGNTLYYQDKIFAGVDTLALVVIGNKGLIFVVNRYGTKSHDKVAWMVNTNGYLTDNEAKVVVNNGLIHTITVTDYCESFEATCAVEDLKVRRVNKTVDRYVPILFLDTLKVSTIEQTGEETYATGGKGNAQLIGWDFGKEITLSLEDALFTPASMSLMWGAGGSDFVNGIKEAKKIDSMQKVTAPRSFIVPAGNSKGVPAEGETGPEAVYINPRTMEPYQDGEPITEGEVYLKWTRSIAYEGQSIGKVIEISADKFAGTYRVVGETWIKEESTGKDHKYQFVIPKAKVGSERTITLEADGDPTVNTKSNAVVKVA